MDRRRSGLLAFVILIWSSLGHADTLTIGTKQAAPFSIKLEDGTWTGISIELWRQLASELGVAFRIEEYELEGLLAAVETGKIDLAVGAITINAAREERMDFSHPIHSTGLAIAVRPHERGGALTTLARVFSKEFGLVVLALMFLLASVGAAVWFVERRTNPDQFGGSVARGIGAGIWWSGVTMTTVGYGDKAPITVAGRSIALVWMFAAIIVTSLFTASMTSALTVHQLETSITGPDDLPQVSVATVRGSTSDAYLTARGLAFVDVPDVERGMRLVEAGEVDAILYDAPLLRYTAHQLAGEVEVLPITFRRQDYGFALPPNSPLRERINRALLAELRRDRFRALLQQYLGDAEAE